MTALKSTDLRIARTAGVIVLVLMVAGCATRPMGVPGQDPGFWWGLLHGAIAPFTFVISLFSEEVRMYAFPNVGRWYDFGFLLGLSTWGGGAAASNRS